jgi:carboxypeptidase Q
MRTFLFICLFLAGAILSCTPPASHQQIQYPDETRRMIRDIFEETLVNGEAYDLLGELCLDIGPRLSGSAQAEEAIYWVEKKMAAMGFDSVYKQPVMVPHWERGKPEVVRIAESGESLNALAIGGSVATPPGGIQAQVIEVMGVDEVEDLKEEVRNKIVFYNRPFDQRHILTGAGYGGTVGQRSRGPVAAAKYGALAMVMRSASSAEDDAPHTGTQYFEKGVDTIPALALGVQSSIRLSQALAANPALELFLQTDCQWYPDAPSHNVIAEIRGSEFPEKIIVVGGHLDSWDVGHGAHDDGAGCMQAIEVLRTLQALDYQPRHTIRAVMFINEENGTRGGHKYADLAKERQEEHLIAIESDAGGFSPRGFGFSGPESSLEKLRSFLPLFPQATIHFVKKGGGGVDVGPLHRETNTPMMGLTVDSQRMFDLHHSPNDVFGTVNKRELHLGAASLTAMIYLIDQYGL